MTRSYRSIRSLPLSREEREEARRYRKIPLGKKLAWLDRMRSLTFELWKRNPSIYRAHQKFRRGEI